jgi:hypothetical protein
VVTGISLFLLGTLPLSIIFFYNWSYAKLVTDKVFRRKWGSLYLGLVDSTEKSKRPMVYKYPALQVARQFVFALCSVLLQDYGAIQVSVIFLLSVISIFVVSFYSPYKSRKLNKLQILYDTALVILCDILIAFNGGGWLSKDQNVRFNIGWVYVGVFVATNALAVVVMVYCTLRTTEHTVRRRQPQKSQEELK